jgi:hypothetical protein
MVRTDALRLAGRSVLCLLIVFVGGESAPALGQQQGQTPPPWYERIRFGGDLRLRYEGFFQEALEARHRERFRLRIGISAPVTNEMTLGFRLASGDPANATSPNQSFGDFLARKPLHIDQLFITYTPRFFGGLTLGAGKFGYPVSRTQMVWDDDVNWEGTYQQLALGGGNVTARLVAVQSPIHEVAQDLRAMMFGGAAEIKVTREGRAFQVSVANYRWTNAGHVAVALDRGALRTQNTNLLVRDGAGRVVGFQSDFNLVDFVAQATLNTGNREYPIVAVANVVSNRGAVTTEDTGLWLSGRFGRATTPGTLSFGYTFARIEQEAVLSAYSFSDIPGTNLTFNGVTLSYAARQQVHLDFTGLFTRPLRVEPGGTDSLLGRIQIDARIAF